MASCVSESSYNLIFAVGLATCIAFLIAMAYCYDRFKKGLTSQISQKQIETAKTVSATLIFAAVGLTCMLLIMYFGFTKRYAGVYTSPHAPAPRV